ncbi:M20/M25/M40 family metallo-hydrolase [Sphingobacterium spiritivorum]|uniref:M20/M25/M40 family metallo-hydrolase n=1 Tax=Sphingobacterium spiritivorum TaxID=258 RepID=UPI003DA3B0CC
MNRLLFLLFLFVGPVYAQDYVATYKQIIDEVDHHYEGYRNLREITSTIGHRLTGSANGRKAEQYVYDLIKSYGVKVEFQPFDARGWNRGPLRVEIKTNTKDFRPVKAVSLAHAPVSSDVEVSVVDLGNGLEEDYVKAGNSIKGKVALVYLGVLPGSPAGTGSLHRSEKTAIAYKYGAAGIVFINQVKGNVLLTGTASVDGELIKIPAVCIGLEDGMQLKEELKKNAMGTIRIHMKNEAGMIQARNIIATFRGTKFPDEKIIVGGHLDSWDLATGAIDNGIGSFAVLDMIRAFAKLQLKTERTVQFVLFMGEEQGLLGSKAFVDNLMKKQELENVRYMINYDMTNAPTGFFSSRSEVKELFAKWGDWYAKADPTFKNIFVSGAWLHSDHQPFLLKGIPYAGGAGDKLPNDAGLYYHSDGDVFSLVSEDGMKQTTKNGLILAYSLANEDKLPVKILSGEELKNYLKEHQLETPLRISGDWVW